jgi:2,3-bisphosphoglycerate-dependent phosphoglycerate mutase
MKAGQLGPISAMKIRRHQGRSLKLWLTLTPAWSTCLGRGRRRPVSLEGCRSALGRSLRGAQEMITDDRGDRRILFLFRHGETDWNREGRLQGHTDVPLNSTGLAQAEALSNRLRPHRLDAVLSSDLSRALTTGRIVAENLGLPLATDRGLRETNVGAAEGMIWAEAKARFGEELTERWYSDNDVAFPGGETGLATLTRGLAAVRRFAVTHPHRRIGVSTHGAMVRQLVKYALPDGSVPVRAPNTALFVVHYELAIDRLVLIAEDEIE